RVRRSRRRRRTRPQAHHGGGQWPAGVFRPVRSRQASGPALNRRNGGIRDPVRDDEADERADRDDEAARRGGASVSQGTDDYCDAAFELLATLLDAINDPADAVRLLLPLTSWQPELAPGSGPLADQARATTDILAATLRTAACGALAQACAAYRP